jgi:hypothetical protein
MPARNVEENSVETRIAYFAVAIALVHSDTRQEEPRALDMGDMGLINKSES